MCLPLLACVPHQVWVTRAVGLQRVDLDGPLSNVVTSPRRPQSFAVFKIVLRDTHGTAFEQIPGVSHALKYACIVDDDSVEWATAFAFSGDGADVDAAVLDDAIRAALAKIGAPVCVVVGIHGPELTYKPAAGELASPYNAAVPPTQPIDQVLLSVAVSNAVAGVDVAGNISVPYKSGVMLSGGKQPGEEYDSVRAHCLRKLVLAILSSWL